jgi:3-hydroxyisobutyrate dehydrogenase
MVGGPEEALAKAAPVLEVMGGKTVHCGDAGAGQAAKICNNMITGATMAVTCEAFALADRLGLTREAFYDVASTSSGQSWSMTSYCPAPGVGPESPADRGYVPGFAAELMLKDLRLAVAAAEAAGARVPVGAEAMARYAAFVEAGGRGRDFGALLEALERE